MGVTVAPVTREVIAALLADMRDIDRVEVECLAHGDPAEHLLAMARRARRSRAAYIDGRLICIFGVSSRSIVSRIGCPWALMTRAADRPEFRREIVADSRIGLEWLSEDFGRLWNLVAEENRTAIRWLKWLGFRFGGHGVTLRGHRFLHFEKETDLVP